MNLLLGTSHVLKIEQVGFQVLAVVVMKSFVFRDKTPCIPMKVDGRFGGICRLYFYCLLP
jgi:hypothetical protein